MESCPSVARRESNPPPFVSPAATNSMSVNPSEFLEILEGMHARVKASKSATVSSMEERRNIRSVVGAWFSEKPGYRHACVQIVGEGDSIRSIDETMHSLLKLSSKESSRRTISRHVSSAVRQFTDSLLIPVSRAYWSMAPAKSSSGRDEQVALRLRLLDPDLADSYQQAVQDAEETGRLSYRGPAAELREVLTTALHILAPNPQVEATDWYREARRSGARKESTPTRAERTKFILRARTKGSAATEAAEAYMISVEERLASLVSATYKRGSSATHGGTERDELLQLFAYINALLLELLPIGSPQAEPQL